MRHVETITKKIGNSVGGADQSTLLYTTPPSFHPMWRNIMLSRDLEH